MSKIDLNTPVLDAENNKVMVQQMVPGQKEAIQVPLTIRGVIVQALVAPMPPNMAVAPEFASKVVAYAREFGDTKNEEVELTNDQVICIKSALSRMSANGQTPMYFISSVNDLLPEVEADASDTPSAG